MKKLLLPLFFIGCALSGAITLHGQSIYEPYRFTTLAGNGPGSADGTGGGARFNYPESSAVDVNGNVYVADSFNSTIRKVTSAGLVTTLAGVAGERGYADDIGSAARFNFPAGVAIDNAGNVYVADLANNMIRKITPAGSVSTLAGSLGSGSADGTGSAARFFSPTGVAVDSAGNVYVGDFANHTIRKITPAGNVSTLAGSAGNRGSADGTGSAARFNFPAGVAVDSAGNVYVADSNNGTVRKITPDGIVSTLAGLAGNFGYADGMGSAARFSPLRGVAVDTASNVYVADTYNSVIRKITPAGLVSTLAGSGSRGTADGTGNAARFANPRGVAVDTTDNVYVADYDNSTIRKITPAAAVSTLAGSATTGNADGSGSAARFDSPKSTAVDTAGNIYVADAQNHTIRKITPAGDVSTLAGLAGAPGSADGTGSAARFSHPNGVAVDSAGNLYVADTDNHTIRKITSGGVVSTLAGLAGAFGSADGTGSAARFYNPEGTAVDSAGNVYVADTVNNTIRKITSGGVVSTLAGLAGAPGSADGTGSAARFYSPEGTAVDAVGNVYVADFNNFTIRKITPAGVVSTFAGTAGLGGSADGPGGSARFAYVRGVAADGTGNLFVADSLNNIIRKITPAGRVSTVGGLHDTRSYADGTGSEARFDDPSGVAVDVAGQLYVADTSNNTIRAGALAPPVITSPSTATATQGQLFVYQVTATGTPTSYTATPLPAGLTFDTVHGILGGTPTNPGTTQIQLTASNSGGTGMATLTLTVQPAPPGPVIASGTSLTARTGVLFSFDVFTTGGSATARLSATGLPPGLSVDPVTGIISGTPTADGSFGVTLTVTDGGVTNTFTLELTFTSDPAIPVIISPRETTLAAGQFFTYTIVAPGDPSEQTTFSLIGNLPSGLVFDAATGTISGTYNSHFQNGGALLGNVQLIASNSSGTATSTLAFFQQVSSTAKNISTRLAVGTSDNVLIGGFIVTGNAPKKVIVRAIGPELTAYGVPGALQDPTLELYDGSGALIAQNDDWQTTQIGGLITADQSAAIQASGLAPTDNRESAMIVTLDYNRDPASLTGHYTAIIRGKDGTTGAALVEVYDLGTASLDVSSNAQLGNISTRGLVQTGDNVMIGGFIVRGDMPATVIVRAIGPSLTAYGVPGALQDPTLELHDGTGAVIGGNDNWQDDPGAAQIQADNLAPSDPRESATIVTLAPGNYTAIVRGTNETTGVALVEAFVLQ